MSRSRSRSRNSKIREKPIQKIHVHICKREYQSNLDIESASRAVEEIVNNKKLLRQSKKQKLKLYSKSMSLSTVSWFQDEKIKLITFNEYIKKFYLFKTTKNFLILGLQKPEIGSMKSFIILRISNINHLLLICDTIEKENVQNCTADDIQQIRSDQLNNRPSQPIFHSSTSLNDLQSTNNNDIIAETKIIPVAKEIKPIMLPNYRDIDSLSRSSSSTSRDSDFQIIPAAQWKEETKFISYKPGIGNVIDNNGSIYLYTAQQITPDYSNIYSSSLFSVSDSSSDESSDSNTNITNPYRNSRRQNKTLLNETSDYF